MNIARARHILTVAATTRHLALVREFIARYARSYGLSQDTIQNIRLAVDEAFTNIVKHAYGGDEHKNITVEVGLENGAFRVALIDLGRPFNPATYREPDIPGRIQNGKRGGVGIYLIRQLMDSVDYQRSGDRNIIILRKQLPEA